MKTYTIANQKGGVGKSTIACHLSWYLRDAGKQVLHIDLDPQGNSSETLKACATPGTVSGLFAPNAPAIEPVAGGLTLLAADAGLLEIEKAANSVIKNFCDNLEALEGRFDAIVIDTAPTAGVKMSAALIAATDVLAPIELESYSILGFQNLIKTIIGIKQRFNPSLNFIGALPNRFNAVNPAQKAALEELLAKYPQFIVPGRIPTRTAISEAIAEGIPVWKSPKSSARDAGKEFKAVLELVVSRSTKE